MSARRGSCPGGVFEFVDRGAEDEVSLRNNRAVFERISFKPRTLTDVSGRSQEITLLGQRQKMPIVIAPTGIAGLLWHEGEIALARAAKAAEIPFTLAIGSLTEMERVAAEAGGRLWFQLYMWGRTDLSHQVVDRAWKAGYEALILTVDGVVPGNRDFNVRNGFTMPFSFNSANVTDVLLHPRWLATVLARYVLTTGMPRYANYPPQLQSTITSRALAQSQMKCEDLNYEHLRALRKRWPGLLIVKGIAHPHDAVMAVNCGADAVVVSNHGGRNLDGSMAPLEALPQVVDAVGKRVTVMVDGGYRRGSDVVKALALGAKAVMIRRATLHGVATAAKPVRPVRSTSSATRSTGCSPCSDAAARTELGTEFLHTMDPWFSRFVKEKPMRAVEPAAPIGCGSKGAATPPTSTAGTPEPDIERGIAGPNTELIHAGKTRPMRSIR